MSKKLLNLTTYRKISSKQIQPFINHFVTNQSNSIKFEWTVPRHRWWNTFSNKKKRKDLRIRKRSAKVVKTTILATRMDTATYEVMFLRNIVIIKL